MRSVRLAVLGCSVIVCLLLAEVLVRYVLPVDEGGLLPFPYNASRIRQIKGGDTFITYDADLGWTLTPSRTRRSDGAIFRINSQSLRADRDYPLQAPSGTHRITAVGDSFTHCSEVTQEDCWTAQLEDLLPDTEVLNFGVPGYGPDQTWLRYQRDGRPFGGCTVLIGYFVGDIERTVNRFRPFIHPDDSVVLGKPRFQLDGEGLRLLPNAVTSLDALNDPVWVEQTLGPDDDWYFPYTFVASPLDGSWLVRLTRTAVYRQARQRLLRTDSGYPLYDDRGEAYQLTRRILLDFVEEVRADGAAPVVLVMPGLLDLQLVQRGSTPYAQLVHELEAAGVPLIDVTSAMIEEMQRHTLDEIFREIGNAVVARTLARELPPLARPGCDARRTAPASAGQPAAPPVRAP
jgi:hypothetical protein